MSRRRDDDDDYGSDDPDFEQMREDNFDEEAATERAERSYERAMFGD
ncbi:MULTISPECIES: hypothetical protein [Mycolicibacterium]|jgi:hypothetical protein|nr:MULTISPECIES: hypothetical protein [Mycolicibacterium]MCC9179512.1 hypothetical protein [Mycolicibacterium mageritense]MCV7211483.1 hypothetical protein [Mycolicibacterium canariasense]